MCGWGGEWGVNIKSLINDILYTKLKISYQSVYAHGNCSVMCLMMYSAHERYVLYNIYVKYKKYPISCNVLSQIIAVSNNSQKALLCTKFQR